MPENVEAAAGDLDPTFGLGGKVTTPFPGVPAFGSSAFGVDVAIQADGKIVMVGTASSLGFSSDFFLVRYNSDGSLDMTFGVGGKVTTDFSQSLDQAWAVAIQSDGKIIVVGRSVDILNDIPSDDYFALARYNSDGSLDTTFGAGGKVKTDLSDSEGAHDVVIQGDKIVVVGFARDTGSSSDFVILRYNADGSLDPTFGLGGKVTTDFFTESATANAVSIQPDGQIIAAGDLRLVEGIFTKHGIGLARYNSDGSLDTSFGKGGKVVSFFRTTSTANALALQPDGKVVVAGAIVTNTGWDFALARYNNDGSPDSGLDSDGFVSTDLASSFTSVEQATDVAIQPDGKIILVGRNMDTLDLDTQFLIVRYNPNGSLGPTFGSGGKQTTNFSNLNDGAAAVALQFDGKIVVGGSARVNGSIEFAIARYKGDDAVSGICLQDESNGNRLQINQATGDYLFTNCGGLTLGGRAKLNQKGCTITFQHNSSNGRVTAKIDTCSKQGFASFQSLSSGRVFTIIDRNTHNNTCSCR